MRAVAKNSILGEVSALAGWLALTFVAAGVGAIASIDAGTFYGTQLAKPPWAPPPWVFAPVWNVLYLLMGLAAWLVWRERRAEGRNRAMGLYVAQLVANALWSWLFFAWRNGALAFGEVLLLLALILATLVAFWKIRPLAGVLMLPYAAWVTYASALTWAVWQRNLGLL